LVSQSFDLPMKRCIAMGLLLLWAGGLNRAAASDTVYFLLAEIRASRFNDSFVLPLTDGTDIAYARRLIAEPQNNDLHRLVTAIIAPGADGVNRNYYALGAPEWSWHVAAFGAFSDGIPPEITASPTLIEWDPVRYIEVYGAIAGFINYNLVAELGPFLKVNIADSATNIVLHWTPLGTNYSSLAPGTNFHYTVESKAGTSGVWAPAIGQKWPLTVDNCLLPKPVTLMFYRVKAHGAVPFYDPTGPHSVKNPERPAAITAPSSIGSGPLPNLTHPDS
jgi:hypothetical protein